jgi:hypothetical protein
MEKEVIVCGVDAIAARAVPMDRGERRARGLEMALVQMFSRLARELHRLWQRVY